jgi:hypothetical protein
MTLQNAMLLPSLALSLSEAHAPMPPPSPSIWGGKAVARRLWLPHLRIFPSRLLGLSGHRKVAAGVQRIQ